MAVDSLLPRDLIVNNLHFQTVDVAEGTTDYKALATALVDLWQAKYGSVQVQVTCGVYDVGPPPNFPIEKVTKGTTYLGTNAGPREVALCLSFARNQAIPSERGRIYLMPGARTGFAGWSIGLRPTQAQMDWALGFYSTANQSLPDIGGVDIKFGIYSPTTGAFTQASQAWVDDEWDTVRRRGLRATTRSKSVREG